MKKYLKIREAAELLNVTRKTLRNWDKQGKLKPYRHPMNNYRIYVKEEILALYDWIKDKDSEAM